MDYPNWTSHEYKGYDIQAANYDGAEHICVLNNEGLDLGGVMSPVTFDGAKKMIDEHEAQRRSHRKNG